MMGPSDDTPQTQSQPTFAMEPEPSNLPVTRSRNSANSLSAASSVRWSITTPAPEASTPQVPPPVYGRHGRTHVPSIGTESVPNSGRSSPDGNEARFPHRTSSLHHARSLTTTSAGRSYPASSATSTFSTYLSSTYVPRGMEGSSDAANHSANQKASVFQGIPGTGSTTSVSSIGSTRSTSASSLLYHFKKTPMDMQIPFMDKNADPELVKQFMEEAKKEEERTTRNKGHQIVFRLAFYIFCLCVLYFGLIGFPLWNGIIRALWYYFTKEVHLKYMFLVFMLWGTFITWMPLLFSSFEQNIDDPELRDASETCLIIPAYKAAGALPETIQHALKIFKPQQIFIIANGNSPTPLDNTEDVCKEYGVRHIWVPIGSKITAEFVGVLSAQEYKYALLIDDDVHLPANFPLVTNRLVGKTRCVGYTIRSTGANGSKGTLIQQAQDLEYKMAGMAKVFTGKYGSAVFPHGAVILWDRNVLEKLFWSHPGFHISEDWYFGHTCRSSGYRIEFCSQVFVETETPPSLFQPMKSVRGGYGEMTVYKQRFYRWNFFFIYRIWDDLLYLFFAWRLGRHELITKIYVLAEIYDSFSYVARPFIWPITLAAAWKLSLTLMAILMAMYLAAAIFFNAWHLRRKNEMIAWKIIPVYMGMKFALIFVNTASVYYALVQYGKFFSVRHPRVLANYNALDVAMQCVKRDAAEAGTACPSTSANSIRESQLEPQQPREGC